MSNEELPNKDYIGPKKRLTTKIKGKYKYLVVFLKLGDPVLQVVNGFIP